MSKSDGLHLLESEIDAAGGDAADYDGMREAFKTMQGEEQEFFAPEFFGKLTHEYLRALLIKSSDPADQLAAREMDSRQILSLQEIESLLGWQD